MSQSQGTHETSDIIVAVLVALLVVYVVWRFIGSSDVKSSDGGNKKKKEEKQLVEKPKPVGPFTMEEVAKHATYVREDVNSTDAWIVIDKKVYEVSAYVDEHQGGEAILRWIGKDATAAFHGPQHGGNVQDFLLSTPLIKLLGDLEQSKASTTG